MGAGAVLRVRDGRRGEPVVGVVRSGEGPRNGLVKSNAGAGPSWPPSILVCLGVASSVASVMIGRGYRAGRREDTALRCAKKRGFMCENMEME